MNNISKNLEDISRNLSIIKDSYYDLEVKISQFSQELPKLEGQIDILGALATTMEKSHLDAWAPETVESISKVGNKPHLENITKLRPTNSTGLPEQVKINQD
ncbi:hypothetical protein evm_003766 [Chilo suppressalis]|nr:hypothetical protein evm_003766 [Chilo suppressalis]